MRQTKLGINLLFILLTIQCFGQNVPILNYSTNNFGQVELEIEASSDKYYLLTALHPPNINYESITSMTLGIDGNMIISEPLQAFPVQNYKIEAFDINDPLDTDLDGIDDISEFNSMPAQSALNFAQELSIIDGTAAISSHEVFANLAVVSEDIPWAPFLNNQEFVKFAIINQGSDKPEIYFINSVTHEIHADFLFEIDIDQFTDDVVTGEVVYNPNEISQSGAIGTYTFNFSFGASYNFEHTRRTYELLAANMPYLDNNLDHFIGIEGELNYISTYRNDYEGSRLNVILESEFFADVDYIPFNKTEGYGFFRQMTLDENPGSRDIVLYDVLPNSLPRVGGIITSVVQTPLSHVNLRAIQDNVPNAYIKEPLDIPEIANLLGKYIYYRVGQDGYEIREASLDEVNAWFEKLRPSESQIPERNLDQTEILPLDEIEFKMSNTFGAKCSNVATMRKFGFPEGTIPDGFGVPFYYYDEFMKFNNFYDEVKQMMEEPSFISDLETRIDMLSDFRKKVKAADMPQWMLDDLDEMHKSFPVGTAVRCRSSTNNEDLPGFSGAGLYTSKTQHLDEGHISKSIKQVYASMWNFRAFEERDFYRVDHFIAAMGVLCHSNFQDEKSNGVGISIDPIYQTEGNFYLNTQVGEFLVTNPDANSIPEEILLNEDPDQGYFVLRNSNLIADGELVMGEEYLDQMREYLGVIHDEFEMLYNVVGAEGFGMDIEYKVTKDDQLIIKQARPWVSFWGEIKSTYDLALTEITSPISSSNLTSSEIVKAKVANQGLRPMEDFEVSLLIEDQIVETISVSEALAPFSEETYEFLIPQDFSIRGDYNIGAIVSHDLDGYDKNDTLKTVITNLHLLEGKLAYVKSEVLCNDELNVTAQISNLGETTFFDSAIEIVVNGIPTDTFHHEFSVPYLFEVDINILITENLLSNENEITLNLISINGEQDFDQTNNSTSFNALIENNFTKIFLEVSPDMYAEENAWLLVDNESGQSYGNENFQSNDFTVEFCVPYSSCLTLTVTDFFGDGICCEWGEGNFRVVNSLGETLVSNDGNFGTMAEEMFCVNEESCTLNADVKVLDTSGNNASDGSIIINPTQGIEPYEYSIDGGQTFMTNSTITDLETGAYNIVVTDASGICVYQELVEIEAGMISNTDDLTDQNISIYPNPTLDNFTLTINDTDNANENVKVEIYDSMGRLIQKREISKSDNQTETTISLANENSGSYVVKCYNQKFQKFFNLIKI